MTYRIRNIVIAVVLAALAALMVSFYVTNYKRHVQQGEDHVSVWVAARDIPAGTPGSDAAALLTEKQVTKSAVVPGSISSKDDIKNLVAAQKTFAGEQVTLNRFTSAKQVGVHGKLKGVVRAIQIQGNSDQLLVGTLRTGDHVDVVATFKAKAKDDDATYVFTRTVLRDVEVLRAPSGGASSKLATGPSSGYSTMLAVTDAQANKLWFTATTASGNQGATALGWSLTLRAPVDATDSPESVETISSILRDGLSAARFKALFDGIGGS